MVTRRKLPVALEHDEAVALMQWVDLIINRYPELELLFHVPNGGFRSKNTAKKLKAEGVKKGVPDYILPVARGPYHGLFLELKRTKGGKTSPEQEALINKLRKQGYLALVAKGWEHASRILMGYLSLLSPVIPEGKLTISEVDMGPGIIKPYP